jgi:hypothetical protein
VSLQRKRVWTTCLPVPLLSHRRRWRSFRTAFGTSSDVRRHCASSLAVALTTLFGGVGVFTLTERNVSDVCTECNSLLAVVVVRVMADIAVVADDAERDDLGTSSSSTILVDDLCSRAVGVPTPPPSRVTKEAVSDCTGAAYGVLGPASCIHLPSASTSCSWALRCCCTADERRWGNMRLSTRSSCRRTTLVGMAVLVRSELMLAIMYLFWE